MIVRDKFGREIMEGDMLKIFHFTGARRKKYYLYQLVYKRLDNLYVQRIVGSVNYDEQKDAVILDSENSYPLSIIGQVKYCDHVEIVQGFGPDGNSDFENRPRVKNADG